MLRQGDRSAQIAEAARSGGVDAVIMKTGGRGHWQHWFTANVTSEVIYQTTPPLFVLRPTDSWRSTRTRFGRLLVTLDGSETAEQVLPYVYELASRFKSEVILISVLEGAQGDDQEEILSCYLARFQVALAQKGIPVRSMVMNSAPVPTILRIADAENIDLIMMVSHGRGGIARQSYVKLGSVVAGILKETSCPVFLLSALPSQPASP